MHTEELFLYTIDMKYIRNLHNKDDNVLSVSPQKNKSKRPFLGIIIICKDKKYCIPLSKAKKKHYSMRDKVDFKKITDGSNVLGVLNFNLMIPVEKKQLRKIDIEIHKHDNSDTRKKKELLKKELDWCNEHIRDIENTANVLYDLYKSDQPFSARDRCVNFEKLEKECKRYNSK